VTGVIHRTDRTIIRMFGRDPLKMIQGLATNDIAGAAENQGVYTAFLTPKGKMVGDARVVRRRGGDIWIECDGSAADNIVTNLRKFVAPLYARFDAPDTHSVIGVYGNDARAIADQLEPDVILENAFRADAFDLLVPAPAVDAKIATALGAGANGIDFGTLEVMRIEAGEPKWGAELTEDVIPLEAGLRERAISESKGCYTGQEVIIRILHRGHVNRHLRGVLLGTNEPAQRGAELLRASDQKVVGTITSSCYSPAFAQAIALAYVRREVVPPATLHLDTREVTVVELPFANVPHSVQS
jgi:folate-binding protein YgfZ